MVVKLYFTDGSNSIRNFTNDELYKFKLLDNNNLQEYIENYLPLQHPMNSWDFVDSKPKFSDDIFELDLRDYYNLYESFKGVEVDNKVVDNFEFLDINSYEYNLSALAADKPGNLYLRFVRVEYDLDHYRSYWDNWPDHSDRYNDE